MITEQHLETLEKEPESLADDFMQSLAAEDLVRELAGDVCFCGARKTPRQTFCRRHYFALTPMMRAALYNRMGQGYEEAYGAARRVFQAAAQSKASQAGRITLGALGLLLMILLSLAVFVLAMSANV